MIRDPLYKIYRLTLGINDADRMNWPNSLLGNSDQGAPVYLDSQTNQWKPLDFGNQTLFYRITDSYPGSHTTFNTAPLKADIKRLDFSIDLPGCLANASFSEFTVINRSTSTWNNTYLTVWTDDDLGFANDDKVGCDSAGNLGYTYNGTATDPIYGIPPAVGFVMLRGALYYTGNNNDTTYICRNKTRTAKIGFKDLKMGSYIGWGNSNDSCTGNPSTYREAYRFMSGFRRCGTPWIHPNGYPTKYVFSGDPVTNSGWICPYTDDQRFMMSTGPVNMNPGDTQKIVIAQVIARGTSNLNSITLLRQLTEDVKNYYKSCYNSDCVGIEPLSNELPTKFQLYQNYPNPFNPVTKIKFDIPSNVKRETSNVKMIIYDILGREIKTLMNEELQPGTYEVEWDATNYPSGVYFYELSTTEFTETKKMVLLK